MMRIMALFVIIALLVTGCQAPQSAQPQKTFTEQDVRNAVTELFNGINSGNMEVVKKYVNAAGPAAEKLVEKLKNNVRLINVRDVSIQGTRARATVTLEVVPLNIHRDVTIDFDITDALILENPLGLLSIML